MSWKEFKKKKEQEESNNTNTSIKEISTTKNNDSQMSSWKKFKQEKDTNRSISWQNFKREQEMSTILNRDEDEKKDTWFKGSKLFDDGYQFGDISGTVVGTVGDAGLNLVKGVAGIGEGLGDAISYGIADIHNWTGNDARANEIRTRTQKNVIDSMFTPAENYLDEYSVLGEKSDSIAEGLGYVAGITAVGYFTGGVGVTATTFTNGMANGMTEALNNGASIGEARLYGAISGAGEAISELAFGGLGKASQAMGLSKGALDDVVIGGLTKNIKNKMVKTVMQSGLKAAGEGLEEIVSGLISAAGKRFTYMDNKKYSEIVKDENLAEQFWMGALTSAISQGPSSIKSIRTGTDYITGRTDNEQKVYDNEVKTRTDERIKQSTIQQAYNEQIKIQENLGIEITEDLKTEIMQKVERAYDNGTLKSTELSKKDLIKIEEQVEADMQEGNISVENIMKTLGENQDLSKDNLLMKSMYENEQKYNSYKVEQTDNDKVNILMQSAADAGMNNTSKTRKKVELISKLVKDTDRQYKFVSPEQLKEMGYNENANGLINKATGEILINARSDKGLQSIVGHETTHIFDSKDNKGNYSKEYKTLQDMAIEYAKVKGIYDSKIQSIASTYGDLLVDESQIKEELTADLVGDFLFNDEKFIENLATKNRNVFQKIYDYIKHIYKVATAGTDEAKSLENLKYQFDRVYKNVSTETNTDTKYSIGGRKGIENAKKQNPQYAIAEYYYNKALKMAKKNINNEQIRQETNWFQDKNGDWKFEFSDKDMALKKIKFKEGKIYKLGDILEHNTLFTMYPELANYRISFEKLKQSGVHNRNNQTIKINSKKIASHQAIEGTLIHEIQHAIQKIEDFESGGSSKLSKLAYYNKLGEIEADDTKQRFLKEKYGNLSIKNIAPESSKTNPKHSKLENYLKNRNIIDKMKDGLYNYINKKISREVNHEEIFEEDYQIDENENLQNQNENSRLVVGRRNLELPEQYRVIDSEDLNSENNKTYQKENSPNASENNGLVLGGINEESENNSGSFNLGENFDNEGRTLSKEQQEYFKDSKARDENGNLLEVYHGTSEDFAEFDISYLGSASGDVGFLGDGFYFATHKGEAKYYGNKIMNGYVNIKNPYNIQDLSKYNGKTFNGEDSSSGLHIKNLVELNPQWRDIEINNTTYGEIADEVTNYLENVKVKKLGIVEDSYGNDSGIMWEISFKGKKTQDESILNYTEEEMIANELNKHIRNQFGYINNSEIIQYITEENRFNKTIKTLREVLQEKGYDSIVQGTPQTTDEIVIFNSNQFKNVDNINPTSNPNITLSLTNDTGITGDDIAVKDMLVQKRPTIENEVGNTDKTILEENIAKNEQKNANDQKSSFKELQDKYKLMEIGKRQYEKLLRKENPTEKEKITVDRLLKGEIENNEIPASVNRQRVVDLYNAKVKFYSVEQEIKAQRKEIVKSYRDLAKNMIKNISTWKDKSKGIQYQVNTMKRNLRDIIPDKSEADAVYNEYFKPITKNNATIEKEITRYNERISKYEINNVESQYIQMIGENKYNPDTELPIEKIEEFYDKHKTKIDLNKCQEAVEEFRNIYDELIVKINDVLIENGYKPIEYRQGYFPHFVEDKANTILGKFAEKLGWKINADTLPTDIAGITDQFKPGKAWTAFSQQRKGDATDYNALKGFDNYIRGAMDVIHHTKDIQKLRALENEIRYQYSEKGVQEQIDNIYNDHESSIEEKQQKINEIFENNKNNPMGNLATELRNYTNNLANKKATADRGLEHAAGRQTYSLMTNIQNRVSANMVGANISSAMTNFIPITQAWSQTSTKNILRAIKESIAIQFNDDGFSNDSAFLTNRTKQADRLYKTGLDKTNDKLGYMFDVVDSFTSNVIVRGKYYDNIDAGMNTYEALDNADEFAKDVIAGRSKGDMPTIFNQKNPLTKLFTAFQLEVNNQYGYMLKDLPTDLGGEAKEKLVGAFVKMFLGAFLYNMISEKISGNKSAFSPIDIAIDSYRTISNDEMSTGDKIKSIGTDLVGETPFLGGIAGGGRLSIQGAIPYDDPFSMFLETISTAADVFDGNENQKQSAIKSLVKEWSKPLYYVALPFAGGQLKKTIEGTSMYLNDVPGSYTNSGDLRFTVKDNVGSKVKSAIFGTYANPYAQDYIDSGFKTISKDNIDEMVGLDMDSSEYRQFKSNLSKVSNTSDKNGYKQYIDDNNNVYWYNSDTETMYDSNYKKTTLTEDDLTKVSKTEESLNYINSLDLTDAQKNIAANNLNKNSKKTIDMSAYGDYSSYNEYKYARDYPEKYSVVSQISDYNSYVKYKDNIANIKEQYSTEAGYESKERKAAVQDYINSLDLNQYQKMILEKMAGGYSIKNYQNYIYDYLETTDLTSSEKYTIWEELFN